MEQPDAGFTLCHHLRQKDPSTGDPGYSVNSETGLDFDVATEAERSWIKADAFLRKPIRFEQLKREIDRLSERLRPRHGNAPRASCDDEPGMRLGVARTLRNFTFRMPDVNGDVGFSTTRWIRRAGPGIIAQSPPDILLLDHKMPGISGLEVLDRLAGMKLDMLTIMITAYASIETAVTATSAGPTISWPSLSRPPS